MDRRLVVRHGLVHLHVRRRRGGVGGNGVGQRHRHRACKQFFLLRGRAAGDGLERVHEHRYVAVDGGPGRLGLLQVLAGHLELAEHRDLGARVQRVVRVDGIRLRHHVGRKLGHRQHVVQVVAAVARFRLNWATEVGLELLLECVQVRVLFLGCGLGGLDGHGRHACLSARGGGAVGGSFGAGYELALDLAVAAHRFFHKLGQA